MRKNFFKMTLTATFVLALALIFFGCGGDGGGSDGDLSSSGVEPSSSSQVPSSSSIEPSSNSAGIVYGELVTYGGETYQTVVIGTQTWFARNLNYNVDGSKCYDNADSYCDEYGRLYNWTTAVNICPDGWHLPNNDDLDFLYGYIDNNYNSEDTYSLTAGGHLKSKNGWNDYEGVSGNGTDDFGFAALPGGFEQRADLFGDIGDYGTWWSASENNTYTYNAYCWNIQSSFNMANRYDIDKTTLRSVRCVQD